MVRIALRKAGRNADAGNPLHRSGSIRNASGQTANGKDAGAIAMGIARKPHRGLCCVLTGIDTNTFRHAWLHQDTQIYMTSGCGI